MIWTWILSNWRIVAYGLLIGGMFYAGWHTRGIVADAQKAHALEEQAKQHAKDLADINAVAVNLEVALAESKISARTLEGQLAAARKNPVYAACLVPADGVRLFNAAANGSRPPKHDTKMPAR